MREDRMAKNTGALNQKLVDKYSEEFQLNKQNQLVLNAVTKTAINDVATNREAVLTSDFTFSHEIKTGKATAQKQSGRCWLFAGLNSLRIRAMKKMGLEDFELSQNYAFFWDKLEKSNYFLESIIDTRSEEIHSRLVMWLLNAPLNDGGQWDMFANLINRYGVVPKSVMPETFNSSNSQHMNYLITQKLRENAMELREMTGKKAVAENLRARKEEMLSEIYKLLAINLGKPPKKFEWQYRDKKDRFHRAPKPLTPVEFYKKYVGLDTGEMVSLLNCPTKDKPFNKMYTVEYLGNMTGGQIIRYLNVDIKIIKNAAISALKKNEPVWFGCDVGKMLHRDDGIMHAQLYDYETLLGTSFGLDKASRVDYGSSRMTHAMVFTGVNLVGNKPTKWKVENSWSEKVGKDGFFVMDDKWFDEYMFQIVVPKKYVPAKLHAILKQKPIALKPWDPMGSLAIMK